MKTKLVYVLTCSPEDNYIEQALMSVWSARHWNPSANIVLITDDLTDSLLIGDRGEVLNYITEKIVFSFTNERNMMHRSRWLKTSIRQLITGDFLYIDCDTIICKDLSLIDNVDSEIALVLDSHLPTPLYDKKVYSLCCNNAQKLGWSFNKEIEYFNGGIIYCKDTPKCHSFFDAWHKNWMESERIGIPIDQPSLGLTNIQYSHIIHQLPGEWNCQIYMRPIFAPNAFILHFWAFRNESLLFTSEFLAYVRNNGISNYVQSCILKPLNSMIPFPNIRSTYSLQDNKKMLQQLLNSLQQYFANISQHFGSFPWKSNFNRFEKYLLDTRKFCLLSTFFSIKSIIKINILGLKDNSVVSFH